MAVSDRDRVGDVDDLLDALGLRRDASTRQLDHAVTADVGIEPEVMAVGDDSEPRGADPLHRDAGFRRALFPTKEIRVDARTQPAESGQQHEATLVDCNSQSESGA